MLGTFWSREKSDTHSSLCSDLVVAKDVDISSGDMKDLAILNPFGVFFELQIVTKVQATSVSTQKKKKRDMNENSSTKLKLWLRHQR